MLYDNAQLAVSFCDAFVVTKDPFYSEVVHDILTYVNRDLGHELGGFFGAEDAGTSKNNDQMYQPESIETFQILTQNTENPRKRKELFVCGNIQI